MATRLTLICQGATAATRSSAFPADEALEERALEALLAISGPAWRADLFAVSPMRAAVQTADALALRCEEDADLSDLDFGDWAGRTIAEVGEWEPERLARWLGDPDFDGHGGESIAALLERARAWLGRCASGRSHTVAVTHSAVVRAMAIEVLGAPANAFWRIDIAPLTVTDLRHDGRRWAIRSCGLPLTARADRRLGILPD